MIIEMIFSNCDREHSVKPKYLIPTEIHLDYNVAIVWCILLISHSSDGCRV